MKKINLTKKTAFISCLSVLLTGGGSIIYAMPEKSVTNHLETGAVNITLEEYQIEDGEEILYTDAKDILPGNRVSKIPRVHNSGNDCYIRAKFIFENTEEKLEDAIYGMDENWTKEKDGYWYYHEILKSGDDIDIFEGIKIPENFSQEAQGGEFSIDIDVDAIQSANFTPDYDSKQPWGTVNIIESAITDDDHTVNAVETSSSKALQVKYQGDFGSLLANSDDFFSGFPAMMPGDIYEDTIELKNGSSNDIRMYFRSEALQDSKLLDEVILTIVYQEGANSKTVYSGPLGADALSSSQLLDTIDAGTSGYLKFTLKVPAELDNEYAAISDYVKWTFATEPIIRTEAVKTGDNQRTGLWMMISGCALAFAGIAGAMRQSIGGREDEE